MKERSVYPIFIVAISELEDPVDWELSVGRFVVQYSETHIIRVLRMVYLHCETALDCFVSERYEQVRVFSKLSA